MTEYLFNVTVWFVLFKTPPLSCGCFYNRQRPKTKSWANLHGCFYCSTGHLLYFTVMKLIMSIDLFFSSLLEVGEFFFFFLLLRFSVCGGKKCSSGRSQTAAVRSCVGGMVGKSNVLLMRLSYSNFRLPFKCIASPQLHPQVAQLAAGLNTAA